MIRLRDRLLLEAPQQVPDGAGGWRNHWQILGELWAAITPASVGETAFGGREVGLTRYRITVRAAPMGSDRRPRAGARFRKGSRIFEVQAVREADAAARYLTCLVEERDFA
ncbi:head-tail adaptor protein [Paracoccaceae bacterium GXU_MW_L88]